MTLEAIAGLAGRQPESRLGLQHHSQIPKLSATFWPLRNPLLGIQITAVSPLHVEAATLVSRRNELLMGVSLIVAIMQAHGVTNLASNDADFDCVSGLTRVCATLTLTRQLLR